MEVFEIVIGVVFFLLLFSTIVTSVIEFVNNRNRIQKRQAYLYDSILSVFSDGHRDLNWGYKIYDHPKIKALKSAPNRYPVYISSSTFADVLLAVLIDHYDTYARWGQNVNERYTYGHVLNAIDNLKEGKVKKLMRSFLTVEAADKEKDKINALKENIKTWYDNYQDRVSGNFRKSIKRDLLWYGWLVALLLNINLFPLTHKLVTNREFRGSVVEMAEVAVESNFDTPNYLCEDCSEEAFEKEYEKEVDLQLKKADSALNLLSTSGAPFFWDIPLSSRAKRTKYLLTQIAVLQKQKEDTLRVIKGRFCLLRAFITSGKADSIDQAIQKIIVLEPDSVDKSKLNALFRKYKVGMDTSLIKQLLFFYESVADSTTLTGCLPTATIQKKYDACLTDCGCVERIKTEQLALKSIDNRIENYNKEIDLYDDLFEIGIVEEICRVVCLPFRIINHNLRSPTDWVSYVFGTLLMAMAGSAGSGFWFDVLVKLINIRRAGVKPAKKE